MNGEDPLNFMDRVSGSARARRLVLLHLPSVDHASLPGLLRAGCCRIRNVWMLDQLARCSTLPGSTLPAVGPRHRGVWSDCWQWSKRRRSGRQLEQRELAALAFQMQPAFAASPRSWCALGLLPELTALIAAHQTAHSACPSCHQLDRST